MQSDICYRQRWTKEGLIKILNEVGERDREEHNGLFCVKFYVVTVHVFVSSKSKWSLSRLLIVVVVHLRDIITVRMHTHTHTHLN